jgi:hypothetical protein
MTTIKDLIQETEKGCDDLIKITDNVPYEQIRCNSEHLCFYCERQKDALKKCQTIAEEREREILKDILVRIDKLLKVRIGELQVAKENDYRSSRIIYNAQVEELQRVKAVIENNYKQQLNPAQKKE